MRGLTKHDLLEMLHGPPFSRIFLSANDCQSLFTSNLVAASMLVTYSSQCICSSGGTEKENCVAGRPPLVIAHGGFSGLFPDSSTYAYNLAMMISVPDVVLWCDVQLTKDGIGICFPDIKLDNSSDIKVIYPKRDSTYDVNGIKTQGYFPIDFTLKELAQVPCKPDAFSICCHCTPLYL